MGKAISALDAATSATGSEILPFVQSGETKKITINDFLNGRTFAGISTFTGSVRGPLWDKGGAVYNAKAYLAADGVTDDTTALQNLISTVISANGSVIDFSGCANDIIITSTINIGNGTSSAVSARNNIVFRGASGRQLSHATLGLTKTGFVWLGASGGTMFNVDGPLGGLRFENLLFDCAALANTALDLMSAEGVTVEGCKIVHNKGFAILVDHYADGSTINSSLDDAANKPYIRNTDIRSTQNGAGGIKVGSTGNIAQLYCDRVQITLSGTSVVGIQLGYADHCVFNQCVTSITSGTGLKIKPISNALKAFPVDISFYSCSLKGDVSVDETALSGGNLWTPLGGRGVAFINFSTADGQTTPNTDSRFYGLTDTKQFFGNYSFKPSSTVAGLNVGSVAGDPSSPVNGDIWYDSTANELTARINGSNVALGAGGGGGVSDGDKGDITVSSSGSVWTIDSGVVSNAKLRDSSALSVIGRSANSTGAPADIAASNDGEVLRRSGTTLGFGTVATAGITDDAITNAKLANVATATFKGRTTAGTGDPEDLTATQATALLNAFVGDSGSGGTKGLVPAPATGDATKFLKGNGTWGTPSGSGDVVGPSSATDNAIARFDSTTGKLIQNSGATIDDSGIITANGFVTLSGGGSAGALTLEEGTAPSLVANSFLVYAPTDVAAGGLAYVLPGAAGTGFLLATNSSGVHTLSHVGSTGSGNVVLATSPTIVTPTIASFVNATHNHTNAAGGGQLTPAAFSSFVGLPVELVIAVSDESTAITTGTAKVTFRMPYGMTLTGVRASLNTASSSGNPTVDINEGGVSILSTKLSIDSGELTSLTAATPAVISDSTLADDAEITIDIDTAGTGAKGLKIVLIGVRN